MATSLLRLLRPIVHVSGIVAPGLTGRIAFKAFCTPPRRKQGTNRTPAVKPAASRLDAAMHISVPYPCGSVAAHLFEPATEGQAEPAPSVILLHGWTGEAAFMSAFVTPLLRAGFRVVAFDLPAHGQSTGAELNLPIGVASLAAVARAFAPVHAIVSHSFGGSIALAALAGTIPAQPRVMAERLAMISPPASMAEVTRWFGTAIGLGRTGQRALEARIHSVAGVPVTAFEGADQLARFGKPTLLLHCRDDREVPFAHAEELAGAGPFVRLEALQGLGHRRILQSRHVAAAVADFVAGRADRRSGQTQPISSRLTTASIVSMPSGEAFRQGR
ncbi:MAG TPA: alpha/beta fold hydrolase [Bosea sp. (in: a-proteobacteria)]|uniref:alpha/beta fold hydrolase n=1 Tax=Bosea sp. (in: a-proteobacteria) TaxID=1871050 RepID=UPI002E125993|nr:alpha/beta fold hydrolase [Bosea sp. (in: a-proteobacteria)]